MTIRKIAVDRMHPAFQVTIPTVNSALYVAVRDTLGRRSRVVHWVPPSSSNLSLAQESLTFQFPVPPALDLPVLMEPAGASDSAPFVSSIEKPGNASYQRSWSLQGSMLFEKGARELTNGPPAIALLQRAAGPYTPPHPWRGWTSQLRLAPR